MAKRLSTRLEEAFLRILATKKKTNRQTEEQAVRTKNMENRNLIIRILFNGTCTTTTHDREQQPMIMAAAGNEERLPASANLPSAASDAVLPADVEQ